MTAKDGGVLCVVPRELQPSLVVGSRAVLKY